MKLGLGSAQFGSDYGVTNRNGKPSVSQLKSILDRAGAAGFEFVDTAHLYGDSEAALGGTLSKSHHFNIVTKTVQFRKRRIDVGDVAEMERAFHESLVRLNVDRVYGLLVHFADDLLVEGGDRLLESLTNFKEKGLVRKLGVSLYTGEQFDAVCRLFTPDLIQIPFNLFDQRFATSGRLKVAKRRGIEVHVRSVFLQGVLLSGAGIRDTYFSPYREHLVRYEDFVSRKGITKLQAAVGFVAAQPHIDAAIFGVTSTKELDEIIAAAGGLKGGIDWAGAGLSTEDDGLINPTYWKVGRI